MAKNWDKIRKQSATDTLRNRDVYETQQLDRTKVGKKQSFTSRHIIAICTGILAAAMLWSCWSIYDISKLDNQSAADAKVAVVITEPAPAEPRDLADVTWANMILVPDSTYAKYGYTYRDTRTNIKYTEAEYQLWLDVNRRINSGQCPELLVRANADGTFTYKERDAIAPAPEEPREFTPAQYINYKLSGVVRDNCYDDMGYRYRETYTGTYLTAAEYSEVETYTDAKIQELLDAGKVTYVKQDLVDANGAPITKFVFSDVKTDAVVPIIPSESSGTRYYTPITLNDIEWANMQLVENNSASSLGYSYMDLRTGKFYTTVEYEYWLNIYNNAKYGTNGYVYWMDIADDGYTFEDHPPANASDQPRERFLEYLTPTLMKMNLVRDNHWDSYGYYYYDFLTLTFYSEAEYQLWLDVQNKVERGELRIPAVTQAEIRNKNLKVTDVIQRHLDPLPVKHTYGEAFKHIYFMKVFATLGAGLIVYALLRTLLKKNLDAQNLMNDTSDINQYENDQHIALPEEVQRKFDWFPDVGAHCPVQVSSMISHMMITNKGLNKVQVAKRAEKDIVDAEGNILYYKGEALLDDKGEVITETLPLIDTKFADALYEASGAPKEVRKYYDANKIPYNPDGKDRTKQMGTHKTVADAINKTWTFPIYEPQRPAGAYIVDTEPVNTMV